MADLQICTCQLIFRTEGPCVPMPKSTCWFCAFLLWGFHRGKSKPRYPSPPHPQISCCTLKIHVIQLPSSGLDVACCATHLRTPSWSLAPFPVTVADRLQASWGPEGQFWWQQKSARCSWSSPNTAHVHRTKGIRLICKCQLSGFSRDFFFF